MEIYGARALVGLVYDGEMRELGEKLSKRLMIPEFYLETHPEPPHEWSGSCEALGSTIWLEYWEGAEYDYQIKVETGDSLKEIFSNRMHDLSPWLARYITKLCGIEAKPIEKEKT